MAQFARDYAGLDEAGLVRFARDGDRQAFRAIMQRCNQRLFRVARAVVGSDDEAEDVLQETYLRAFAAFGDFRGESSLLTWLTSITLNQARGRLRKRRTMVELKFMDEYDNRVIAFPGTPDPEAEAGRSETRLLLEQAIDELSPDFRVVFILREIEGLSVEETAAQLGLNGATVKTRHFRARRLLRASLEERFTTGLGGVFPFLGTRCAGIIDRVLAELD